MRATKSGSLRTKIRPSLPASAGRYNIGAASAHDCHASWFGTTAQSGSEFMMMNGSGAALNNVYSQTVTGLTVGETYQFSVWVAGLFTSNSATLRLDAAGSALSAGANRVTNNTGVWEQFSRTFVADNSTVTVKVVDVSSASSGGDFAIDTLELTPLGLLETPEPGTFVFAIAGLALLVLRRDV